MFLIRDKAVVSKRTGKNEAFGAEKEVNLKNNLTEKKRRKIENPQKTKNST
jgi:hypothetical protein